MQAANRGKWWRPAAGIAQDAVVSRVTTPRRRASPGVLYIIRGVLDGHPPAPMAPAFRNRSDRDVDSARQVAAVDRVVAPVTKLDASLASHATSSATSCHVPSRPMIGCSAAIAVSCLVEVRVQQWRPDESRVDRVHADVLGAGSAVHEAGRSGLDGASPAQAAFSDRTRSIVTVGGCTNELWTVQRSITRANGSRRPSGRPGAVTAIRISRTRAGLASLKS